jgi:hypothetical protein
MPEEDEDLDDYDRGLANEMDSRPIYSPPMMVVGDVLDDQHQEIIIRRASDGDPGTADAPEGR